MGQNCLLRFLAKKFNCNFEHVRGRIWKKIKMSRFLSIMKVGTFFSKKDFQLHSSFNKVFIREIHFSTAKHAMAVFCPCPIQQRTMTADWKWQTRVKCFAQPALHALSKFMNRFTGKMAFGTWTFSYFCAHRQDMLFMSFDEAIDGIDLAKIRQVHKLIKGQFKMHFPSTSQTISVSFPFDEFCRNLEKLTAELVVI